MIENKSLMTTARTAGLWYLLLGVSGIVGFLVFHPKVFISGAPEETLKNLVDAESTARVRLILEFVIVIAQALTAVYFYKLFKTLDKWQAWTLGVWGTVNAVAIMVSAIAMASALSIAHASSASVEDKVLLIDLLQKTSSNSWGVGGLFFGLWLFPMGYIVVKYRCMPVWLGRVIILGGVGYLLSTFIRYSGIQFSYSRFLTLPATIGEFWMIGYLLIFGIRKPKVAVEEV